MIRYYLGIIACVLVVFAGCDTVEPEVNPGTHPFFPYNVGDEYVMEEWSKLHGIEFRDTITYSVVDVVEFNDYHYHRVIGTSGLMYFPGEDPLPRTPDTTLFRVEGSKIFSRSNLGDYVYIDFDAPYAFSLEINAPIGFVKDTSNVQTVAERFDYCKLMRPAQRFFPDHIYSKDVGLVKIFDSEYRLSLLSARIGSKLLP